MYLCANLYPKITTGVNKQGDFWGGGWGGTISEKRRSSKVGNVGVISDVQRAHKLFKIEIKVQFSSVFERYDAASIECGYVRFIVTVLLLVTSAPNVIPQIHS